MASQAAQHISTQKRTDAMKMLTFQNPISRQVWKKNASRRWSQYQNNGVDGSGGEKRTIVKYILFFNSKKRKNDSGREQKKNQNRKHVMLTQSGVWRKWKECEKRERERRMKTRKTPSFALGTLHQISLINILICLNFVAYLHYTRCMYVYANYNKNSYKLCSTDKIFFVMMCFHAHNHFSSRTPTFFVHK